LRAIRHKRNDGRIDANGRLHSLARAPKFENFREIEEISRRLSPSSPFFLPAALLSRSRSRRRITLRAIVHDRSRNSNESSPAFFFPADVTKHGTSPDQAVPLSLSLSLTRILAALSRDVLIPFSHTRFPEEARISDRAHLIAARNFLIPGPGPRRNHVGRVGGTGCRACMYVDVLYSRRRLVRRFPVRARGGPSRSPLPRARAAAIFQGPCARTPPPLNHATASRRGPDIASSLRIIH